MEKYFSQAKIELSLDTEVTLDFGGTATSYFSVEILDTKEHTSGTIKVTITPDDSSVEILNLSNPYTLTNGNTIDFEAVFTQARSYNFEIVLLDGSDNEISNVTAGDVLVNPAIVPTEIIINDLANELTFAL
jgi:hypothetical protein